MSTEGNAQHERKSRINLEKKYPAEYVERLVERLSRMLEEESDDLAKSSGSSSTYAVPSSPIQVPSPPQSPPSTQPSTAPQQPTNPVAQPAGPNSPRKPRNPNKSKQADSKIGCGTLILIQFIIIIITTILCSPYKFSRKSTEKVTESDLIHLCDNMEIWDLLKHVNPEDRLLDKEGRKKLEFLLKYYGDDCWVKFIAEKNARIEAGLLNDSLRFMERIEYSLPSKSVKPKNMKLDKSLHFLFGNYISENDYDLRDGNFYANRDLVDAAIRQFKKDACFPSDKKLDSKEVRNLTDIWKPIYSTRKLGIRQVADMRFIYGTSDSDSLITLLKKSGFIADESKLIRCSQLRAHYNETHHRHIIYASIMAGCSSDIDFLQKSYHYDIPDDLETSLRAFQAYHGLIPDGILDEKTIFALRQYAD